MEVGSEGNVLKMANAVHLELLRQGVDVWNTWREKEPSVEPDLRWAFLENAPLHRANLENAILFDAKLGGANLVGANLNYARLVGAHLWRANLRGAFLFKADLSKAFVNQANLSKVDMREAHLWHTNLSDTNLTGATLTSSRFVDAELSRATLTGADLRWADLGGANLEKATLDRARLTEAKLNGAILANATLQEADLEHANLVETDFTDADLTGCRIYGISAWGCRLSEATKQQNLIITKLGEPKVTVDDIEVAQFIYLLLHNEKIRQVIDTITSKAVLILGRFSPERKRVLDAVRNELRNHDLLPILFDFDKPDSKDLTGTVQTLANMARFIIADVTDPSCIPHELAMVVPGTVVPVQPVLLEGQHEYAMFRDLKRRYHWVLEPYSYASVEQLIATLDESVIRPAEAKARELRRPAPNTT